MSDRKKVAVQLTAAEFMAKHAKELAESEQEASIKLLRTIFPEGPKLGNSIAESCSERKQSGSIS